MKKEKDVITQVVSKNRWSSPKIIKKGFSTHSFIYLFPNFNAYYYCFWRIRCDGYGYPTTTAILFI